MQMDPFLLTFARQFCDNLGYHVSFGHDPQLAFDSLLGRVASVNIGVPGFSMNVWHAINLLL